MSSKISINPIPYIIFGIILVILGFVGQIYQVSTLLSSLLLVGVCFVLTLLVRKKSLIYLIDIWILSYIYIFFSEYRLQYSKDLLPFGFRIVTLTEGFIVASFGASLLGYGVAIFFVQKQKKYKIKNIKQTCSNQSADITFSKKQKVYSFTPRLKYVGGTAEFSGEVILFVLFLSLVAIFYILAIITIPQLLYVARSQRTSVLPVGQMDNFLTAIVYTFPVIVAYIWHRYPLSIPLKGYLITVSVITILTTIALGTRLLLGFQLAGFLFFLLDGFQVTKKHILLLLFAGFFIVTTQSLMRASRSSGIGDANIQKITQNLRQQPEAYLSAEGILRLNGLIHLTETYSPINRLPENLFIFYWWVPRQLWPDKPTMAGYWFLREMTAERGFSKGHSVSGGFSMPALLDFGPVAGVFFSIAYGFLLAVFEVFVHRHRDCHRPQSIIAGLLFFGVFFMMRSLHTSLIFMMSAGLVSVVPLMILSWLITSRQPKASII